MKYNRRAIRKLRKERGLRVAELAKSAGITERTLNYIEKGYSDPRASTLASIANALGVSVETFFLGKDAAA